MAVEASSIPLPVGHVPRSVWHAGRKWTRTRIERDREGDILAVVYSDGATELTVLND